MKPSAGIRVQMARNEKELFDILPSDEAGSTLVRRPGEAKAFAVRDLFWEDNRWMEVEIPVGGFLPRARSLEGIRGEKTRLGLKFEKALASHCGKIVKPSELSDTQLHLLLCFLKAVKTQENQ